LCYVRGPVASIDATTAACGGEQIDLNGSALSVTESSPSYSWSWTSQPAGFTSTSQNNVVTPSATTTYLLTVTNTALGCSDTTSITVNVFPAPVVPVITESSGTLTSSSASTYQWYVDGIIINGATAQNYTPTQSGSFTVVTTDANGCDATSDAFSITGISEASKNGITISPNPTNGIFTLSGTDLLEGNYQIEISDAIGNRILHLENASGADLSGLPDGIYFVVVTHSSGKQDIGKIILNKL